MELSQETRNYSGIKKWTLGFGVQFLVVAMHFNDLQKEKNRELMAQIYTDHEGVDPISSPAEYATAPSRRALLRIVNHETTPTFRIAMRLIDVNVELNQCVDKYDRLAVTFRLLCNTDQNCRTRSTPLPLTNTLSSLEPGFNQDIENARIVPYPISPCSVRYCADSESRYRPLLGDRDDVSYNNMYPVSMSYVTRSDVWPSFLAHDIDIQRRALMECEESRKALHTAVEALRPKDIGIDSSQ